MLVVADSSPINILIRIGCIQILPELFGAVLIPPEVHAELSDARTPETVRTFMATPPPWLQVRAAKAVESIPPLGAGEAAAIILAEETRADALLIDEKDGRKAAASRGIRIIGTLGLLEEAAGRGSLDLAAVIERLKTTDFRLDARLVQDALDRLRRKQSPG